MVQHDYLECIGGGSNKFYAVIDLGNGKSLIGYGPRSAGTTGQWSEVANGKARAKVREKLRNGYSPASISSMPGPAFKEGSRLYRASCGDELAINSAGQLVSSKSGAAAAPAPQMPPRPQPASRRRGPNPLKAWF